jgi:hypothetical protein
MKRTIRLVFIGLLTSMFVLIPRTLAFAGSSVDPSTLNPPPQAISPPGTAISCQMDGSNIICQGLFTFSSTFDNGAVCSTVNPSYTFDVVETLSQTLNFTWWYNAAGSLVHAQLHVQLNDVATNTANGVTARSTSGGTDDLFFGTPGDFTTITEKVTGIFGRVTVQGSGTVVHDVGTFTISPTGMFTFHGEFDILQEGQNAAVLVCNALAA